MDSFYKIAVMAIYPDGYIDEVFIEDQTTHKHYYNKLFNESKRFSEIIKDKSKISDNFIHKLDELFVKNKIIVFNNLYIFEISKDKNYLKYNVPNYFCYLPKTLTSEQKNILNDLFNNYNLSDSAFVNILDDEIVPLDYYDILNSVYEERNKHL